MEHPDHIILFDGPTRNDLLPLTFTRPVSELRIGITTIREKWMLISGLDCSWKTEEYLSDKYPAGGTGKSVYIDGSVIPDEALWEVIGQLEEGAKLLDGQFLIARRPGKGIEAEVQYTGDYLSVKNSWDIFEFNDKALRDDFLRLTKGKRSQKLSSTNILIGEENIFVEEGAVVEAAVLNATSGPIYIGRDAEIMEGAVVRGPLALCEHSSLKMGAKIYGATTIGPWCKVGGEVHNSVFTGYSSKAHDGYLGNAVLGEWCNLGADTNNSNLKNNYAKVKLWHYPQGRFIQTGLQFCGLIMGDHSKCGINTMFNTGTVVGVSANIFGAGFPRNFIPSFSWGGPGGTILYKLEKAFETASVAMARRNIKLDETERKILEHIFHLTEVYRKS